MRNGEADHKLTAIVESEVNVGTQLGIVLLHGHTLDELPERLKDAEIVTAIA
jgi:hypothetical protein